MPALQVPTPAGRVLALCGVMVALEYAASPLHRALPDPLLRRCLKGLVMGLVAVCVVYSPWDALCSILAHFAGARQALTPQQR